MHSKVGPAKLEPKKDDNTRPYAWVASRRHRTAALMELKYHDAKELQAVVQFHCFASPAYNRHSDNFRDLGHQFKVASSNLDVFFYLTYSTWIVLPPIALHV